MKRKRRYFTRIGLCLIAALVLLNSFAPLIRGSVKEKVCFSLEAESEYNSAEFSLSDFPEPQDYLEPFLLQTRLLAHAQNYFKQCDSKSFRHKIPIYLDDGVLIL